MIMDEPEAAIAGDATNPRMRALKDASAMMSELLGHNAEEEGRAEALAAIDQAIALAATDAERASLARRRQKLVGTYMKADLKLVSSLVKAA